MLDTYVLTEIRQRVGIIRINRPDSLNALNSDVMNALSQAVAVFENDPSIGCLLITGSDKAFAAGADIKELTSVTMVDAMSRDFLAQWGCVAQARKPIIAAVAGFALGGGCELALQCDIIIAADNARFGQPEIKLASIPGLGGTQRLTRAIGKAKAMELILTGRMIDANEADSVGLITRVVPLAELMNEAMAVAASISKNSMLSLYLAKEAVNRSFEMPLAEALLFERRAFHALLSTTDLHEGFVAFREKREPRFLNR